MKIWIDFINSPQVSFFDPLINELTKGGHEIILTCRDSGNTVNLIGQRNWAYTIIGKKVKKGTAKKIFSFPERIYALYSFLKGKKIDVAISQSSFYLPLTAKFLRVPSIYTNDNEHALGNIPAFLFATKIFIPENLPVSKVVKKGASKRKVVHYPGIKEGIYLWPKGLNIQYKRKQNNAAINKIYVRPEPYTAQYYSGKINFLDNLLIDLKEHYSVTILCREKTQLHHYKKERFTGIVVPDDTIPFNEVAESCLLFIGAGGSMTREMALIGIPTISVYQGDLLEVDKVLIRENLMTHIHDLTYKQVKDAIDLRTDQAANLTLIEKGKQAYQLIKEEILKYNSI